MKYVVTALALAALSASPALAATKHMRHHEAALMSGDAYAAVYQEPGAVFSDGRYLGRDPDPNVRLELLRGQVINAD